MALTFISTRQLLLVSLFIGLSVACTRETVVPASDPASNSADAIENRSNSQVQPGAIALAQRCTNTAHGFSVSYPEGWHTNSGAVIPACSAFHPDPFEIPEASEMPFEIAITISVEPVAIELLRTTSQWEQIVSAERLSIEGREAWRIEARSTGEGLAERGMRTLRYAIDLGEGRTLLASTHGASRHYALNQEVLAAMVESAELPR
jgi:hypothetical protein